MNQLPTTRCQRRLVRCLRPALIPLGLILTLVCARAGIEVWPSQYKIKPWETNRLTAADVVGPDGIVYPNWTGVGVEGGIPAIDLSSNPADGTILSIGGYSYRVCRVAGTDNTAVSTALTAAASYANGGSQRAIVYLPAGTYTLTQNFTVNETGIVIAGAGKTSTVINLTATTGSGSLFQFHAGVNWGSGISGAATFLRGSSNAVFTTDPASSGYAVGKWVRILATSETSSNNTMRLRYDKPEIGVVWTDALQHFGRAFLAKITAVNSGTKTVTFDRTLAHDYYLDESPQMRTCAVIEYCGLQDLTITTASSSVTLEPVSFQRTANSWLKGVKFNKAKNWPVSSATDSRIRCEIRDCDFLGTFADINSGSNAYLGWGQLDMDCLMDNCTAQGLRHMAIFQIAMRCVVRNCTFSGTTVRSPQHHGRLPLENLIEGSTFSCGGESFYTDPPHSLIHGPNGPRNVFYNNQVTAGRAVMQLMGAQENPILVYNRLVLTDTSTFKPALWAFDRSFDGILRGNSLQVHASSPVAVFEDTTCPGWEMYDNQIYGSKGYLWAGDSAPVVAANNRYYSYGTPASTTPEVASIYLWQKTNANSARLVLVLTNRVVSENSGTISARVVRVKASLGAAATVNLSADLGGVSIPSSVTIPAGAAYADFTVTGTPVSGGEKTVTITASASGLLSDTEQVFVLDQDVAQPNFGQGKYPTTPAGLPANWHAADFGQFTTSGTAAYNSTNDIWTIQGAGLATSATHATLAQSGRRFVYQTVAGNGEIRARLVSTSGDNQVGLMIADDQGPITEFLWVQPTGSVLSTGERWDYHASPQGYGSAGAKTVPIWLRLTRTNSVLSAYTSTDGVTWTQKASVDFYDQTDVSYCSQSTLDTNMHFGMFVNSGSATTLATATFSNVVVGGSIVSATASVTLSNLNQTYDGTAKAVSVTTAPPSLPVSVTYDGSASAPTNAGSYTVIGVVNDPDYAGSATNTLVIDQAAASVILTNLNQTYDGTAKAVSVTTAPPSLPVSVTYDGSASAPTNAGSYTVIATVTDLNYSGMASDTLVIAAAPPATPTNLLFVVVGTNLALSWPPEYLGWQLQSQTNSSSDGLGTNWVTLPGSDLLTTTNVPIDPSQPSVFYRLRLP
ncbi:MAG: MBG domain-containing protein [Verrucomicrobia bacterium]|nr:MBG domain-containing protein [Verrucomicrobiota bacterium]